MKGWIVSLIPLGMLLFFSMLIGPVAAGNVYTVSYSWIPQLDINFSFFVDGLGLLFALLITGIGTLIVLYAGSYLSGDPHLGRFYGYILTFMASMLGLVLADNIITLFIFWELTSLTSYLLIGYNHDKAASRTAALQALLITSSGGLALLAGLILLGLTGGSFELSTLLHQGNNIRSSVFYLPTLILILAGAFTKSAQFPFHFWLPNAMEAPTPVSAYLHSATMVKAGIYLLARLNPILGDTPAWHIALVATGAVTMLLGAYLAPRQTDLKRILAYSTVSVLGTLVLLIGIETTIAMEAAVVFLVVHSIYKGALFMIAGIVDHETGTRDIDHVGGLRHAMPLTATAALLAALSFTGIPPLFGFIGKELVYEAKLTAPTASALLTLISVTSNALIVAAGLLTVRPFFGKEISAPEKPHEAPLPMLIGPLLLALLGLLIGLFPTSIAETLISPALSAILGEPESVDLALWHGVNLMLILSVVTVASGVAIYAARDLFCRLGALFDGIAQWGPERWYFLSLDGLNTLASALARLIQRASLGSYLLITILTTAGLAGFTLLSQIDLNSLFTMPDARFSEWVLAGLILSAAFLAVRTSSFLTAVIALGVVGLGMTLIFILFGAPDLAMTQFAVDTLSVILFVLVIYRLPDYKSFSSMPARIRDALVALIAGGFMTLLTLAITSQPLRSLLTPYFAENSVTLAKGRNVVNVILVDFRALDTLGEITVLAMAAIGVYALMKLRPPKKDDP